MLYRNPHEGIYIFDEREGAITLDEEVNDALYDDDDKRFVAIINWELNETGILQMTRFYWQEEQLLHKVWRSSAVKCAAALINGETPFKVDVNLSDSMGFYPLHLVAYCGSARMMEFLISQGARTDVTCETDDQDLYQLLPLHIAMEELCSANVFKEWTPRQSIFKLITILCLPRLKFQLEKVRMLALTTNATEEEFLYYVRCGKYVKLAALLMAAHKRLKMAYLLKDVDKNSVSLPALELIAVFERAGDELEAYSKQDKKEVEQISKDVARIVEQAGFRLGPSDTVLSHYEWVRNPYSIWNGYLSNKGQLKRQSMITGNAPYRSPGFGWPKHNQTDEGLRGLSEEPKYSVPKHQVNAAARDLWSGSRSKSWASSVFSAIKGVVRRI